MFDGNALTASELVTDTGLATARKDDGPATAIMAIRQRGKRLAVDAGRHYGTSRPPGNPRPRLRFLAAGGRHRPAGATGVALPLCCPCVQPAELAPACQPIR